MHHVPNDLRAKKSVDSITKGLESCLQEKPLDQIKVKDLCERCGVSRATFYRLFDSIIDVFSYECDAIRDATMEIIRNNFFQDQTDIARRCEKLWVRHEVLMKALVDFNLIGVLYDSHMRHKDELKELYSTYYEDETQFQCFVSLLVSFIYVALTVYFAHEGKLEDNDVFLMVYKHTSKILETWKKAMPNTVENSSLPEK
ncbi:MAG: TetR/AcrR family transcriptional regulator [Bacilli bacterium]|nr:TetR/AcrR family transcriptional regulator [Bacilli bacterium]